MKEEKDLVTKQKQNIYPHTEVINLEETAMEWPTWDSQQNHWDAKFWGLWIFNPCP